jgi:hypothetical protein
MPVAALLLRLLAVLAAVHGTVRIAGHGQAAVAAQIELDGTAWGVTDSLGRYAIADLAPGDHEFRFMAVGYEPRRVSIFLADTTDLALDVELTPRPTVLPPLTVVAHNYRPTTIENALGTNSWHEAGQFRFATGWQLHQPAGAIDLNLAISALPGVSTRNDNATALSIRGGRGSENLVLLDGVPLIGAVHFAGAPSAINPDAIAMFDVHTGVSSARYDGALSGVIDMHTDPAAPRQLQLTGSVSTTDVRSMVRAPLGNSGSMMLGARSSFRSLFSGDNAFGSSTGYQDFIANGHLAIGRGTLSVVGFASGNQLDWQAQSASANTATLAPNRDPRLMATMVLSPVLGIGDAANWQSTAGGATWTLPIGGAAEWHTVGWWTGSAATISSITTSRDQQLLSGISEIGMTSELRTHTRNASVIFGAEVTRPRTRYTLTTPATVADTAMNIDLRATPTFGSVYSEWDWHGGSSVDFRAGLRANSNFGSSINLDPRLTLNYHTSPTTRLELGFGRTHQPVQSMLNEENLTSALIGPTLPVAASSSGQVARAEQWELSIEHQAGRSLVLTLNAYARTWNNVLTPAATTGGLFVDGAPQYGDGSARGLIGSVNATRGRFALHATAGVTDASQSADGVTYHSGFSEPWSFNGDMEFRPGERTTFQFRWNTGAGQLRTAVSPDAGISSSGEFNGIAANVPGSVNALRLGGPMRLDLAARRLWPLGNSTTRRSSLSTSVRLENLLNRPDPIGIMEQPGGALQLLRGTPRAVVFELGWVY